MVISRDDIATYEAIKNYDCEIIYQKTKGFGAAIIEGLNNSKPVTLVFLTLMAHLTQPT